MLRCCARETAGAFVAFDLLLEKHGTTDERERVTDVTACINHDFPSVHSDAPCTKATAHKTHILRRVITARLITSTLITAIVITEFTLGPSNT